MATTTTKTGVEPKWLSRKDAAKAYAISIASLDELIAAGEIEARKFGRRKLIRAASMDAWAERLPEA